MPLDQRRKPRSPNMARIHRKLPTLSRTCVMSSSHLAMRRGISSRTRTASLSPASTQQQQLVSWSLTSLFSTNAAIWETKGQGWRVSLTQWRKASDILTSTLATFCSAATQKRETDREAHLNYYTSAYNRGDYYHITRLKLNQQQQNKHASLTKNRANINTKQIKPRFGRLLRPPAWKRSGSGPYSGR